MVDNLMPSPRPGIISVIITTYYSSVLITYLLEGEGRGALFIPIHDTGTPLPHPLVSSCRNPVLHNEKIASSIERRVKMDRMSPSISGILLTVINGRPSLCLPFINMTVTYLFGELIQINHA